MDLESGLAILGAGRLHGMARHELGVLKESWEDFRSILLLIPFVSL
jgi:hypothetical protein